MPAIDPVLVPLSRYAAGFGATGTWVSIPGRATMAVARDKLNTARSWSAASPLDEADASLTGLDQVAGATCRQRW